MIKKFLFQMDDPTKINIKEDSTYMLIKESLSRGIRCFYNSPSWVYASMNKYNQIKSSNLELSLVRVENSLIKVKNLKIQILRDLMQFLSDKILHLIWNIFLIHIYLVSFKTLF